MAEEPDVDVVGDTAVSVRSLLGVIIDSTGDILSVVGFNSLVFVTSLAWSACMPCPLQGHGANPGLEEVISKCVDGRASSNDNV